MRNPARNLTGSLLRILNIINRHHRPTGDRVMRLWYWYLARIDRKREIRFLNYGFSDDGPELDLAPELANERYPVQLYHHVAAVDLGGRDVLEVGCGRGGGAYYLAKRFRPRAYTGLDICRSAIASCRSSYALDNLSFIRGDAQRLPFPDASFDVVINVESSHRYPDMRRFLGEVHRVLRESGFFLFTDFRKADLVSGLRALLHDAGFVTDREQCITPQVVRALQLDNPRRLELIHRLTPSFLATEAREFAGTEGTRLLASFVDGEREYLSFVLRKA